MALDDREYYREHLARLAGYNTKKPAPPKHSDVFQRINWHLTRPKPTSIAPLLWRVATWCVILLSAYTIAQQVVRRMPDRFTISVPGGGWGSAPVSTPKAAEPAASANQGKPTRPPLVI